MANHDKKMIQYFVQWLEIDVVWGGLKYEVNSAIPQNGGGMRFSVLIFAQYTSKLWFIIIYIL